MKVWVISTVSYPDVGFDEESNLSPTTEILGIITREEDVAKIQAFTTVPLDVEEMTLDVLADKWGKYEKETT